MCIKMDGDRDIGKSAAEARGNGSADGRKGESDYETAAGGYSNHAENDASGEAGQPVYHKEQADDLRLEDVLTQVEHCLMQLENPQISLEDSFRYYEEGVRKLKLCNEKVAQIEQKMLMINGQGELEDF